MKKFLIGILTILLTIIFLALGISLTIEKTITENVTGIVKEEFTKELLEEVSKNTKADKEEVKRELTKVLEENKALNHAIEESLDKAMDILNGKEIENISITKELEDVINNSEEVLKNYGITLTKDEKQELIDAVNSEEFTKELQKEIKDMQESIPDNAKIAIDAFNFIRSTTFKIILIASSIVILLGIALLKKSYFKWLSNLSVVTIICGIFYSLAVSSFMDIVSNELAKEGHNIVLSVNAMNVYGYILLGIGIVSLILNIVLIKTIKPNKEVESK